MSDNSRQELISTLKRLTREDQAWVIHFLVQNLAGTRPPVRRIARKRSHDDLTEKQWEEYFAGKTPVELPNETECLNGFLKDTAGKTIKPIEKWL